MIFVTLGTFVNLVTFIPIIHSRMVSTSQIICFSSMSLLATCILLFCSIVQLCQCVPVPKDSFSSNSGVSDPLILDITAVSNHVPSSTSTPESARTSSTPDAFHFSYLKHPIYNDPYFLHSTVSPPPVIMSHYYRHVPSIESRRNDGMIFAVGVASYHTLPSHVEEPGLSSSTAPGTGTASPGAQQFHSLDALVVSAFGAPPSKSSINRGGVEAHLTSAARVFVLLYGNDVNMDEINRQPGSITITGLKEDEWKTSDASVMEISAESEIVVGDRSRVGDKFKLPTKAVVVETITAVNFIRIHHPSSIKVNGSTVKRYCILFGKPSLGDLNSSTTSAASYSGVNSSGSSLSENDVNRIGGFPYPSIPISVPTLSEEYPHASGTEAHVTNHTRPVPNRECPTWLHNLWRAESRNSTTATDLEQPMYWRTWHPSIDPVYWCYYNHEHGSYPGNYRPLFGYTAWNNPDNTTHDGRQHESHEGFKVFSFPVSSSGRTRYVIITVHMHLAVPRRFDVRHHTVIFAVLDEDWKLEMELQMKMDFGAAMGTLKDKSNVAMSEEQKRIFDELQSRGRKAVRRINILNIDDGYPSTVDTRYLLSGDLEPTTENLPQIMHGIYEKWSGPLTTCMRSPSTVNSGLTFDVRNPSTGVKIKTTSAVMYNRTGVPVQTSVQYLSGDSGDRMIVIPETNHNIEIGIEHCEFNSRSMSRSMGRSDVHGMIRERDGVFYTDPYMKEVVDEGSDFSVRQYISPSFETMRLGKGKILTVDSWASRMEYGGEGDGNRHFMNSERAVKAEQN